MRRVPRWLTIGFCSLFVGALLGAVVALFLISQRGAAHHVQVGERAYRAGLQAVNAGDHEKALLRFHEALLCGENALQALESAEQQPSTREAAESRQPLLGQAFWLKYKALKAQGFTRLLADNKPLPAFEGQSSGTPDQVLEKLSLLRLPDEKLLRDALVCLREAAYRAAGNAEILRDAVATEVQIDPPEWNHVHAFATTLMEIDPADERGRYLLARLEYEQPIMGKTAAGAASMPMPASKRSRERVLKGLEHVAKLRSTEKPPRWRTLYLEAQLRAWLVQFYRQPAQRKREEAQDALQNLRALLFDQSPGILARATDEDRLDKLSKLDLTGVYGLHQMALELTLEDGRSPSEQAGSETARPWLEHLQKVMDACVHLAGKTSAPGRTGQAADFLAQAALKVMPALASARPEAWEGYRERVVDLANQAQREKTCEPMLALRVADLLTRESQWRQLQQAGSVTQTRRREALKWLDTGITAANQPRHASTLPALHEATIRLLLDSGSPRETISPHLSALRNGKNDQYLAVAALYEGLLAEREGKLEESRRWLEQALKSHRSDVTRRALSALAPLYLTLRAPERALAVLSELERSGARLEQLSPEERAWHYSFLRQPEALAALKIQAHVDAAELSAALPAAKKQLDSPTATHEQAVRLLLEKLPPHTPASAHARIVWAQYLLNHDKLQELDQQLAILKRDHSELMEVMQLEVDRLVVLGEKSKPAGAAADFPYPEMLAQADLVIQNYLKLPKANPAARLAWIKWLSHTGRGEAAKKQLADPSFFADASSNPAVQKIQVLAQLFCGDKQAAKSLLGALPPDPMVDVALLQAAATIPEQQEILASAAKNHHNVGLFKAWSAALALGRGDHAQACAGFLASLEYTRVKPLARQGLTEALISLAQTNPTEARRIAGEALQRHPSEPGLLLGYAYACLQLGDVGSPADRSEQIKDMATALKAYEAACWNEKQDSVQGPWVAARCWLLAQRPDLALLEITRLLERSPDHEAALLLGMRLALETDDPAQWRTAEQWLAKFQKLKPQSPEAGFWRGQVLKKLAKKNEALASFRSVMDKHPRYGPAYVEYVNLLLTSSSPEAQKHCELALEQWRRALPADMLAWQTEVRLLAQQGKPADAQRLLEQKLALIESQAAQDNPIQPVELSADRQKKQLLRRVETTDFLCQGLIKAGCWEEAEKWLQRCLESSPQHEPTLLLLGELYVEQMQKQPVGTIGRKRLAKQAEAAYVNIYQQRKGAAIAGNNLAWLYATELDNAPEAYRIAQEVRLGRFSTQPLPGDQLSADFLETLGQIYRKLDKPELAKERLALFEAARRRHPRDPQVFLHLGLAYAATGDAKQAGKAYADALLFLDHSTNLTPERKQSLLREVQNAQARLASIAHSPGGDPKRR